MKNGNPVWLQRGYRVALRPQRDYSVPTLPPQRGHDECHSVDGMYNILYRVCHSAVTVYTPCTLHTLYWLFTLCRHGAHSMYSAHSVLALHTLPSQSDIL
jgi:hypothetical protein